MVNPAAVNVYKTGEKGSLIWPVWPWPLVGGWDDHVYYNRYPDDMMSGGLKYETHSSLCVEPDRRAAACLVAIKMLPVTSENMLMICLSIMWI